MKAGWLLAILAMAALSGCAGGDATNPNLLAPKVVLAARPDGATVYVHSAFGEQVYDHLALRADNESIANRTRSFSIEEGVGRTGFFLEIVGGVQSQTYVLRARVDVEPGGERARVSFLGLDGSWTDPRTVNLPFERILERDTGASG